MDAERFDDRILRHGFVWLIAAFSAAGGLLQGYAIGLVGGLQDSSPFKKAFPGLLPHGSDRTPTFVIVFLAGAAAGSLPLVGGWAGRLFGRKATIAGGALLGVSGGLIMAAAPEGDDPWLYTGRALSGVAVGVVSVAVPLYQSEIAPVHLRGKLMATFQLAVRASEKRAREPPHRPRPAHAPPADASPHPADAPR